MGRIFGFWTKLTDRQKYSAGFAASWIVTWALDRTADTFFPSMWEPLAAMMAFLREYVLNGYVGAFIAGALIIGFWADVMKSLKRLGPVFVSLVIPFGILLGVGFGVVVVRYFASMSDPVSFWPPPSALLGPDGKQRTFTIVDVRKMRELFEEKTQVGAQAALRAEVNKWIAIMGTVEETRDWPGDWLRVTLKHYDVAETVLLFDPKWEAQLARIDKGGTLFAVCRVFKLESFTFTFSNCELVRPVG